MTQAVLRLFKPSGEAAANEWLEAAIGAVDEYLTQGEEDSAFHEPAFQNTFNNDLNGFLKWEQLGKSDDETPRFVSLMAITKRTMGRGQPSPRELITAAIR